MSGGVTYTQKHQISTGIDYEFYFANAAFHWTGGFDYKRIPFDFYGVGDGSDNNPIDTYTPLWIGGDFRFTTIIVRTPEGERLTAGISGEVRHDKMLASRSGGILEEGTIPGSRGGLSSGLGVIINYDTRDNIFATHDGLYLDFTSMYYGRANGSDFRFNRYSFDLRSFTPVLTSHTFALQGLLVLVKGTEPFYTMAGLGGNVNMRGYFKGRFRDNDMAVVQGEYRLPLLWRFSLAGFADVGEVAGWLNGFTVRGIKCSAGAGIRFAVVPEERLGVRLDFGVGNNSSEVYFSILEAF